MAEEQIQEELMQRGETVSEGQTRQEETVSEKATPEEAAPEDTAEADESVAAVEAGQAEDAENTDNKGKEKKSGRKRKAKDAVKEEDETEGPGRPENPEAAIEAILFATGHSVKLERLAEVLSLGMDELQEAIGKLKAQYEKSDRGIILTELEDAVQLGTKGEYYEYLMKLAKTPKRMTLSDTVIETLSIIAYKQPVTRAEIERIRGVSCDHALNRLLEYELVEELGRLDAPGKPLLFGTTEQFLRCFGVKSIGDLPAMSPELIEDFKEQAEAEAEEDLKVHVDV